MPKPPHAQAQKIYRELLELFEELTSIYVEADDSVKEEDEEEVMDEDDLIDLIVEEAAERGLDEELTEKVLKNILTLAKKSAEG